MEYQSKSSAPHYWCIWNNLETIKKQLMNEKYLDNIVDMYCKLKRIKLIGIEVYLLNLVIYLL